MSFNEFFHKYKLKNKVTSEIKNYQVLYSIGLDKYDLYLRAGPFSSDIGIVNLHRFRGIHWVLYMSENFSDSYGCSPPQKRSKFIKKRKWHCLYSEYKIHGLTSRQDSYCASYCLYIIYLTKVLGLVFKSSVLNLYYQMKQ